MATVKVQFPDNRPLARLYFDNDCAYPGWYVEYRLNEKIHTSALPTWDPADVDEARAVAAKLLCCSPGRIQVDSR